MDVGLLIVRLAVGGFVAAHGLQKLTHRWGGGGLTASVEEFRHDGFVGGWATALLAGGTQVGAGIGLAAGLFTPLMAAGVIGVMTVAVTVKLPKGFWAQRDGYEYPAFLALTAIAIAWTGPGRYSLDAVAGLTRDWTTWPSVAATVLGIGAALAMRQALHRPQLAAKTEGRLA